MKIKKILPKNYKVLGSEKKTQYINCVCSVDLECTSFKEHEEKRAIPYIYGLAINNKFTCFRTREKFIKNLNYIAKYFRCNDKKRLLIFIHNLNYDIQFLFKYFEWGDIFANDKHNIFYAVTQNGLEFRDSLQLSGCSLEQTAKICDLPIKKLSDYIDYDLIKSPLSKLPKEEFLYLKNDCLTVTYYIKHMLQVLKCNLSQLPLTKTGIVREDVRDFCLNSKKYKKTIQLLKISGIEEYKSLKNAFQGGFTHANAYQTNTTIEDVTSFDFTSSYPSVMLLEKMPMSKAKYYSSLTLEELKALFKNNCVIFTITLTNLYKKYKYESFIATSKLLSMKNIKVDNGRITRGDYLTITITQLDFEIIEKIYNFKILKIYDIYAYKKGYLPIEFKQKILEYYGKKTSLKGVEGAENEYALNKEKLNSLYGMSVMDLVQEEYTESEEKEESFLSLVENENDLNEIISKYNKNYRRFLFYPWGVFITAYARYNLFNGIFNLKEDYIYADTDSVKFVNFDNHKQYFEYYNNNILEKIKKVCESQKKLDIDLFMPKTKDGKVKVIGVWDYDGHYDLFKTLGAKRYMYVTENKLNFTIAGVNKKSAVPYLLDYFKNNHNVILDYFDNEFKIPSTYIDKNNIKTHPTGKLAVLYSTEHIKGVLKDFQNNYYNYNQCGFVYMEPTTFEIKTITTFKDFAKESEEKEGGLI